MKKEIWSERKNHLDKLGPEGTGYRMRTRFAKFFNLPELINLFREVADIKTADQLHLPTPEVEYHTVVSQPTEHQKAMVQELSERAGKVHSGIVDAHVDNMLKITSDGRKLGLDQRILNPTLPDEAETKVNRCVANILQQWRDGEADKLTQLVFCDISTPKPAPSSQTSDKLDDPVLHTLEKTITLEPEKPFTIYEDIRQKLIAAGMPPEQIAFIHEANTDVQKKELFAKVRSGAVRVLIGSTQKMGAGTNVQDRLIALHDLDCPWRPRDLIQRKGRIERRGNQNEKVHVYRYVTESTFDSYLWQTVENKQKFISQIMTSKSPVRTCDDVDETALSFAEIKALCAGDPHIKERMELEVDVARLKMMKADHESKQFRMEDRMLKYFPEQIRDAENSMAGFQKDEETVQNHPHPTVVHDGKTSQGLAEMIIHGKTYTDRESAGKALLDACQDITQIVPVEIGRYRGFTMSAAFSEFQHKVTLKGEMSYSVELGQDPRGNITRLDNLLGKIPEQIKKQKLRLDNLHTQREETKKEAGRPFPQEQELRDKSARLAELDAILSIENHAQPAAEVLSPDCAARARPSLMDSLRRQIPVKTAPPRAIPRHYER